MAKSAGDGRWVVASEAQGQSWSEHEYVTRAEAMAKAKSLRLDEDLVADGDTIEVSHSETGNGKAWRREGGKWKVWA